MDGEILHLIALLEKIEFKFIINTKNQYKFQFTWNPSCACFGKKKSSNLKLEWSDNFFEKRFKNKNKIDTL